MEEELAESQESPEDASADGDETQMTESRKGDGEGDQQVRGLEISSNSEPNTFINWRKGDGEGDRQVRPMWTMRQSLQSGGHCIHCKLAGPLYGHRQRRGKGYEAMR